MIKKVLMILATGFMLSFIPNPPKELTVTLTLDQWQNVIDVIDKSNAPHSQVKQCLELIAGQLQKQLADTTKPKK